MRTGSLFLVSLWVAGCAAAPSTHIAQPLPAGPAPLAQSLEAVAASRGRAIALAGCASCHAIDPAGSSPYQAATPFRDIVKRRSLDSIALAMNEGLVTSHPAMPPYTFRAAEIDDLRAYLETLRN